MYIHLGNEISISDRGIIGIFDIENTSLGNDTRQYLKRANDDGNVIKKAKGVFKKPVKKWYWGFGLKNCEFKPYGFGRINPILYINHWSMGWKPKYDYVCFEIIKFAFYIVIICILY